MTLMQRPYDIHSGQSNSDVIAIYKTSSVHYSSSWDSDLSDLLHKVDVVGYSAHFKISTEYVVVAKALCTCTIIVRQRCIGV